jgi:hypothetical protein
MGESLKRAIAPTACTIFLVLCQMPVMAAGDNNRSGAAAQKIEQEKSEVSAQGTADDQQQNADDPIQGARCGTWVAALPFILPFLALAILVVAIVFFNITLWVRTLRPGP